MSRIYNTRIEKDHNIPICVLSVVSLVSKPNPRARPALGRDANGVVRARGAIRLYEPRALHRKGKSLKMAVGKNKRMSKGKKGGKKKAYV